MQLSNYLINQLNAISFRQHKHTDQAHIGYPCWPSMPQVSLFILISAGARFENKVVCEIEFCMVLYTGFQIFLAC